ncbi:hypothetical protein HDU96_008446 [Phlyctochytrium bullatum]|nr:hypothetical protein HDU96_008446 [Phlyctochytrium bullatum]
MDSSSTPSSPVRPDSALSLTSSTPWQALEWGKKALSSLSSAASSPPRNTKAPSSTTPGSPSTLVNETTTPPAPLTPNGASFTIPPPLISDHPTASSSPHLTGSDISTAISSFGGLDQSKPDSNGLDNGDPGRRKSLPNPTPFVPESSPPSQSSSARSVISVASASSTASKRSGITRLLFGKSAEEQYEEDLAMYPQDHLVEIYPSPEHLAKLKALEEEAAAKARRERTLLQRILWGKGSDSDDEETPVEGAEDEAKESSEAAVVESAEVAVEAAPVAGEEPAKEDSAKPKEAKPERGFWMRVLYGKGDTSDDEDETPVTESSEEVTLEGSGNEEPPATSSEESEKPAAVEVVAPADEMQPTPVAAPTVEPTPVAEAAVAIPSTTPSPLLTLPSLRTVGKLVQSLPGVSLVSKLPGASTISQLPVVSNVIDSLFVDHKDDTAHTLSTAAVTPAAVIEATAAAAAASAAVQSPTTRLIEPLGKVPTPVGSVAWRKARQERGETVALLPPPTTTDTASPTLALWGVSKTLNIASSSLSTLGNLADMTARTADRVLHAVAPAAPAVPPTLFKARDAALGLASGLFGRVAGKVAAMGGVGLAKVVHPAAAAAVAHTLSVPVSLSPKSPTSPTTPAAADEDNTPYLARMDTFRHFCAFPPGQVRNPLSFSFSGGCGLAGASGLPAGTGRPRSPRNSTTAAAATTPSLMGSLLSAPSELASTFAAAGTPSQHRELRYALGAARVIRERFRDDVLAACRFLGSGFGAIVAAAMAVGAELEEVEKMCEEMEALAGQRFLGGVGGVAKVVEESLRRWVPEDVGVCEGRLVVSVTRWNGENVLVDEFGSRERLIKVLMGSCYLPILHETPVFLDGHMLLSGTLTNPLPVYDGLTITISSFPGEANVGPFDPTVTPEWAAKGYAVANVGGDDETEVPEDEDAAKEEEDGKIEWGRQGERDMGDWFKAVTGSDELLSDAFKVVEIDDIAYEVNCEMITIKEGDVDIGGNPSAEGGEDEPLEDGAMTVNNVVHSFRLQSTGFDKKSYMTYIKGYMKALKAYLNANDPDRVAVFESKVTPFVKKILENFKDYEFYVGEGMNPDGMVILLNYREDGTTPYLTFFKDGLKIEKINNETMTQNPLQPDAPAPADMEVTIHDDKFNGQYIRTLRHAFTPAECEALLALASSKGWETALLNIGGGLQTLRTDVRKSDRSIVDDEATAAFVCERIKPHLPTIWDTGRLAHLNERLRFLKYGPSDYFAPHYDGAYGDKKFGYERLSFVTVQVYLNEGYEGGETTFFDPRTEKPLLAFKGNTGDVAIFEHGIFHEGTKLVSGTKYALRTDVMYR